MNRSTRIPTLLLLAGLTGCQPPNRTEQVEPSGTEGVIEVLVAEGVTAARPVAHHRLVIAAAGGLTLHDPLTSAPSTLTEEPTDVRGAVRTAAGSVLVATDDDLLTWEHFTGSSDLAGAVPLPLRDLVADGTDLWLPTDEGLFLWRRGWLSEVRLDRQPVDGAVAVRDQRVWIGAEGGVYALEPYRDGWAVILSEPGPRPDALAVDGDGTAWVASGGDLLRFDDHWTTLTFPDPVAWVDAHPAVPGAWVRTEGRLYHVRGDAVLELDEAPPEGVTSVDEAGRLLVVAEGALLRVSPAPGGVLVGVEAGTLLSGAVTARVQIAGDAEVADVEAWVDDAPVTVSPDPWRVRVEPGLLSPGSHTLTARIAWEAGPTTELAPVPFQTAVPDVVTWDAHLAPLHQRSCAVCHDGGTETVLATKDDWQASVEAILQEVVARRMPLTGTKLTDAEIEMIRVWQDGGFP